MSDDRAEGGAPTLPVCPVVGIGASAGGLEPLEALVAGLPRDCGAAFVVATHRAAGSEMLLTSLLAARTRLSVVEAEDGAVLVPRRVYVAPPACRVTVEGGVIRLTPEATAPVPPTLVDTLFCSLAREVGARACGVVLSGSGADGVEGVLALRDAGGFVLAQAPETAKHGEMPRNAIDTGDVHRVLSPEKLALAIAAWTAAAPGAGPSDEQAEDVSHDAVLADVCTIIRRRTGHDFRNYKHTTLLRRIRRRAQVLGIPTLNAYVERLRTDASEPDVLFANLLIGVTHFFRDPEVFDALVTRIVPRLFGARDDGEAVRVWLPACATGEEAYSIAILLREHMMRTGAVVPRVQIFATDIDAQALAVARHARYPATIEANVSRERLERFFVKEAATYQVSKEIREMCVFSLHDLLRDPPFSRLDLVSCRNLLIYLEAGVQKRLVGLFHYALRQGGFLLLGPSENVAAHSDLFRAVDQRRRIFERRDSVAQSPAAFTVGKRAEGPAPTVLTARAQLGPRESNLAKSLERIVLEGHAPATVVVNELAEIVYYIGRTAPFLEPPRGTPTGNLLQLARKGLRVELRAALQSAATSRAAVTREAVHVEDDGSARTVELIVRPLDELGRDAGLTMIVFRELTSFPPRDGALSPRPSASGNDDVVAQLEDELRTTREHLSAAVEELETSNEELKSTNEELLSLNEELQSTIEELQTSKEEIQSVNEELETVNTELQRKVEELDRTNGDLQNLLTSTQIATVFLDRELRIKRFTPAATDVFRLIESDVGRPITDIAQRFASSELVADVRHVLDTLEPRKREVRHVDGVSWFVLTVLPYWAVDRAVDGVVLTFVNVTDLKRAEAQRARLAAIVESSDDAILGLALDGVVTSWNASAEKLFGYSGAEAVGRSVFMLVPEEKTDELVTMLARVRRGERVGARDTVRVRKDGARIHVSIAVSAMRDQVGNVTGVSVITRDIEGRVRTEQALGRSRTRVQRLLETRAVGIAFGDARGGISETNDAFLEMIGYTRDELVVRRLSWDELTPPEGREQDCAMGERLAQTGACGPYEKEYIRKDGTRVSVLVTVAKLAGDIDERVVIAVDNTPRRAAEDALKRVFEELRSVSASKEQLLALLEHELEVARRAQRA